MQRWSTVLSFRWKHTLRSCNVPLLWESLGHVGGCVWIWLLAGEVFISWIWPEEEFFLFRTCVNHFCLFTYFCEQHGEAFHHGAISDAPPEPLQIANERLCDGPLRAFVAIPATLSVLHTVCKSFTHAWCSSLPALHHTVTELRSGNPAAFLWYVKPPWYCVTAWTTKWTAFASCHAIPPSLRKPLKGTHDAFHAHVVE